MEDEGLYFRDGTNRVDVSPRADEACIWTLDRAVGVLQLYFAFC